MEEWVRVTMPADAKRDQDGKVRRHVDYVGPMQAPTEYAEQNGSVAYRDGDQTRVYVAGAENKRKGKLG